MSFSKDNLKILKDIKPNELLALEDNKIFIDNRYLLLYRTKYSVREIISVIDSNFKDCINLYKNTEKEEEKNKIKCLINDALNGYDIMSDNYSYREDRKELIKTTKDNIDLLIQNVENEIETDYHQSNQTDDNQENNNQDKKENNNRNRNKESEPSTLNYIMTQIINSLLSITDYMSETYNFFFN